MKGVTNKLLPLLIQMCCNVSTSSALLSSTPLASRPSSFASSYRPRTSLTRARENFSDEDDDGVFDVDNDAAVFDAVVDRRYACTRFQRSSAASDDAPSTMADPVVLRAVIDSLETSLRAPTGFNAQPYQLVLVSDPAAKTALAKHCLGRNADRVRDSDCTVVFLADTQVGRDFGRFRTRLLEKTTTSSSSSGRFPFLKLRALILLFSSGYPLPRVLARPLSLCVRLGVSAVSLITGRRVAVPSLASAETWATKNTMLVAMTFLLSCAARGLATCPMEGFHAVGVKRSLDVTPQGRYKVPLIVSVGTPFAQTANDEDDDDEDADDAGMRHSSRGRGRQGRYSLEETASHNRFDTSLDKTTTTTFSLRVKDDP